jgi:tetratricopeptide (TPR) repeat protein
LREQPTNEEIRNQVAELYARIGDFDTANRFEPEPGPGQLWLQRRYEELIEVGSEAVIDRPDDTAAKYLLAFAYNAEGEYEAARSFLERLGLADLERSMLAPTAPQYALTLADALQALGAYDEARPIAEHWVEVFRTANEITGTQLMAKSWWSRTLLACGELQLARDAEARGDVATKQARQADALAALTVVRDARGLVWTPLLEDSPCFEPVANEPVYLDLVARVAQRQQALRERLPATLLEYGVADVRP